jgi:predicted site-specific integrase-resolvase
MVLRNLFAKLGTKMAIIGYARVSTLGQSLSAQLDALKAAGADLVFRERVSGVRADRPQLAKLMAGLKSGDIVLVTKLDRLGRSTRELLNLIEAIEVKNRRARPEDLLSAYPPIATVARTSKIGSFVPLDDIVALLGGG